MYISYSNMELFHAAVPILLTRRRYYVLFPIPAFTVQVTKYHLLNITCFQKFNGNLNALQLNKTTRHVAHLSVSCKSFMQWQYP
jgi:hypothetical protein